MPDFDALRTDFVLPTNRDVNGTRIDPDHLDRQCTYLCGNSLGPLPKRAEALVQEELRVWGKIGVHGHFSHPHGREWTSITDHVNPTLAELIGAKTEEVACMGTLTANLNLMINIFYRPTAERFKILCEAKAFPSDQYAFASQVEKHGIEPGTAIIALSPRPGEFTLREEDILTTIKQEGNKIALVLFPGVQYYTGQHFPIEKITRTAKEQGCICAWDLAHAIGNVPLELHAWDVDFAVWCSYKYLNAGPGAIGGLFIHERWDSIKKPEEAGWWGHDPLTRFRMPQNFMRIRGAQGFQQSNPSALNVAALMGSLEIFRKAGMMPTLRSRSIALTSRLERALKGLKWYIPPEDVQNSFPEVFDEEGSRSSQDGQAGKFGFTIITPSATEARGCQLSLLFLPPDGRVMQHVHRGLTSYGVIADERQPSVIRFAPCPLFNREVDCDRAVNYLEKVFQAI